MKWLEEDRVSTIPSTWVLSPIPESGPYTIGDANRAVGTQSSLLSQVRLST